MIIGNEYYSTREREKSYIKYQGKERCQEQLDKMHASINVFTVVTCVIEQALL